MKVYILFAEMSAKLEQLVKDARAHKLAPTVFTMDDRAAVQLGDTYGLVWRPAVLVTFDDGTFVHSWQGPLPSISELEYTVRGRM